MRRERPGALLARRTRTMNLCSFDARSEGQSDDSPGREGVMVQRRKQEALARAKGTSRRAIGWTGEKAARSGRSISPHPWRGNGRAWKEYERADGNSPGPPRLARLARPASLSCSFGLFGLSGLFDCMRPTRPDNQTDRACPRRLRETQFVDRQAHHEQ